MKVYELMNALANLPSGMDVFCFSALTVNELVLMDNDDENTDKWLYEVSKPLDNVDKDDNRVYLGF